MSRTAVAGLLATILAFTDAKGCKSPRIVSRGLTNDHSAFREKVRTETRQARSVSDPTAYAARVQLGWEMADVLLKNVVQAQRVETPALASTETSPAGDGVWSTPCFSQCPLSH